MGNSQGKDGLALASMRKQLEESRAVSEEFFRRSSELMVQVSKTMGETINQGGKLLICGNGGSASDSLHFSGEMVGRMLRERRPLPAIALTGDVSGLTAIGNDYGYEYVFSRGVEALGREGDILFGISTSGNSQNLIQAMQSAKNIGLTTVGLLGKDGGSMKDLCDLKLVVPSHNTQHIQEAHIVVIHELCALIDNAFKNHFLKTV